jgi:hypothetical protein
VQAILQKGIPGLSVGWPADFTWYKLLTDWGNLFGSGIGALVGGALTAYAAYLSVKTTLKGQAEIDAQKLSEEVAGIRRALHKEVQIIASQCLHECRDWSASPAQAPKSTRTAKMPPLAIYHSISPRIGLLTNDEVVPLIGFSGAIYDAQTVVQSIDNRGEDPDDDEKKLIARVFSAACGQAADFLSSVKDIPPGERNSDLIGRLREEARKYLERPAPPYAR